MKITKLERGIKSKNVNIYVDEEYSFSVVDNTVIQENLFKGKEITQTEIDRIQKEDIVQRMFYKSIERISSRPRSIYEIRVFLKKKLEKLKKDDIKTSVITCIVNKLLEKNYLNDEEFAQWWIRNRMLNRGKSKLELKKELFTKGLRGNLIEKVLSEEVKEEDLVDIAQKLADKKKRSLSRKELNNKEEELKVKQYLQRKGYGWNIINKLNI